MPKELTQDQIRIIRMALDHQVASHLMHLQECKEVVDILEFGCGVTVRSCDEETAKIINVQINHKPTKNTGVNYV